jgi:sarcosine oxidase subunit beta
MSENADIVLVGGGIFGLALSWELARRRRRRIVVVEKGYSGSGATGRNIGRVRTSQFSSDLAVLAKEAFAKHLRLADELGSNTLFWRPGYALVFYDDDELATIDEVCAMLRGLGLPAEYHHGASAVTRRLPILEGGEPPAGCLIRPDGVVHHDALLYAYRRAAIANGVELREQCAVSAIERRGGRVDGVVTSRGQIRSPMIVNATGGWSRSISQLAGLTVPNVPLRREVVVTDSWQPLMRDMITFYRPVEGWFHQTLRGEVVLGVVDPEEPQGFSHDATDAHLYRIGRYLLPKAPKLSALRAVRQWAGVYDMTPDRKPMVGPVDALPGFVQANGDNGRGIALIPYLAELLAAWLDTGERPAMLAAFDANRYAGREETPVVVGDYYAAYQTRH